MLFFAKLNTIIFGAVGVILGVIYSIGGLFVDLFVTLGLASATYWGTPGLSFGTILALQALIGMPAIFAGLGFVVGIIGAILYNLIAWMFGGIETDFK